MSATVPKVLLNNGNSMPILGLGTWRSKPGEVTEAVKIAIDCGYRHIDCAYVYGNEAEVGAALKAKIGDGTVKREDLFITSKLWNTFHSKHMVLKGAKESMKNLGLDYLDLFLVHWPMGYQEGGELFPKDEKDNVLISNVDYLETWPMMEELVRQGLVKTIGLSNFNKRQIERVFSIATIKPSVLQVECHPELNQKKLIDYCRSKGMVVTSYSPLGNPDRPWAKPGETVLLEDSRIRNIAKRYGKPIANILIRYQVQRGVICIPKSVTKSRIESNFKVFDFELTPEDMAVIDSYDCNGRLSNFEWLVDHPHYPFADEF